jgi:hypothetical protein
MPNGATLRTAIANMHKDQTGTYHLLMRVFGPAIVTSNHIMNAITYGTEWTAAVTDLDEAFILLAGGIHGRWKISRLMMRTGRKQVPSGVTQGVVATGPNFAGGTVQQLRNTLHWLELFVKLAWM